MHPILTVVEWGGAARPLGSYGGMLALALLVGSTLCVRAAARAGLDVGATIATLSISLGSGLVGADLTFIGLGLLHTRSLEQALAHHGLVFYGGALFGWLGGVLAARAYRLPAAHLLDLSIPALPLGHALGRVGCLLGGCCYGAPYAGPWAVRSTQALAPAAHPSVPRHPWPLYEAAVLLLLAAAFSLWPARRRPDGQRFATYVVAYACARALLEPLRGDSVRGVFMDGWVSTSQWISLLMLVLALAFLLGRRGHASSLRAPGFAGRPPRCT